MTFINTTLVNPKLIHGFEREVGGPITVVTNGYSEYRISKVSTYRIKWNWPARLMKFEDRRDLAFFFRTTAGFGLHSFKFTDPDDYRWGNWWMVNDVRTWIGQGFTPGPYGPNKYKCQRANMDNHPIFHPNNDVVITTTSPIAPVILPHTFAIENGIPMFTVPGHTGDIRVNGTFNYAARFDQTTMGWAMAALNSDNTSMGDNVGDVRLIEVFEHA
jgi:hypothetical protein